MSVETPEAGTLTCPIVRFICWLFRHPLRVELPSKFTPVTWPDDFSPRGGMFYPSLDDLESNEIETTRENSSCTKIEKFKRCWCDAFFDRTYLDYEA